MVRLFRGVIFQLQRALQLALQMSDDDDRRRPRMASFVLAISPDTFLRKEGFDMVRWVAYRHGFGTYMHFIKASESRNAGRRRLAQAELVKRARGTRAACTRHHHQSVLHFAMHNASSCRAFPERATTCS